MSWDSDNSAYVVLYISYYVILAFLYTTVSDSFSRFIASFHVYNIVLCLSDITDFGISGSSVYSRSLSLYTCLINCNMIMVYLTFLSTTSSNQWLSITLKRCDVKILALEKLLTPLQISNKLNIYNRWGSSASQTSITRITWRALRLVL